MNRDIAVYRAARRKKYKTSVSDTPGRRFVVPTEEEDLAEGNFAATPYPVYDTGRGDDDSVQTALLVSHAGAAVERNQDAGFNAMGRQMANRDILKSARDSDVAQLIATKDSEIRRTEQFAQLRAELAQIRAEGVARDNAALAREVSDVKAAAGQDKLLSVLTAILQKVS